jgi:hypothetical protein
MARPDEPAGHEVNFFGAEVEFAEDGSCLFVIVFHDRSMRAASTSDRAGRLPLKGRSEPVLASFGITP